MRYFIGLDNGGTTTKAAVFDELGHEIAVSSMSTAMLTPFPGFVERDMEEMWQANCTVVQKVLQKSNIRPADVACVGVCGHGKGLYLWGKDGKPVRNGIISSDNRAYEYPLRWRKDGTEQQVFARSCQHIMACQPVALLAWLRDHEPESMEQIQWVFACKDYIRFRLTGEARAEYTDYSGANLLNLHTRSYDHELLRLFGLECIAGALPPLCLAAEICGHITAEASAACGLPEGTPVIGGMFDIDACALAVNVLDEQSLCMIAGTWSINEYLRKAPIVDGSVLMNSLFCVPDYYLIEESSATSAGNNEWFVRQLLPELSAHAAASGEDLYAVMNRWVEEISPYEFVPVFLPFLMASNVHPNAKGAFVGLSVNHTRKHLLRSVYEGIAFSHRYHIEKLLATRDTPPKSVRMAGGAARSAVWTQIFADVLQLPIETVSTRETGALGCAIAGAVASGVYSSMYEAAAAMSRLSVPVYPRKEYAGIYNKKYAFYRKTIDCLDPLWTDMQDLIEEETHA